jgi:predicted hotdog family 3-hydroxylacyl-ACP dehydratase
MLIDKAAIRRLVPHAGTMCLIDGVSAWDDSGIACTSDSHRDPDHPLRRDGRLAALHAFEYGAQAAAIHGGLLAATAGRPVPRAWLGALRDARLHVDRLDSIVASLEIAAVLLLNEDGNAIYRCRIAAAGASIGEARITIMRRT